MCLRKSPSRDKEQQTAEEDVQPRFIPRLKMMPAAFCLCDGAAVQAAIDLLFRPYMSLPLHALPANQAWPRPAHRWAVRARQHIGRYTPGGQESGSKKLRDPMVRACSTDAVDASRHCCDGTGPPYLLCSWLQSRQPLQTQLHYTPPGWAGQCYSTDLGGKEQQPTLGGDICRGFPAEPNDGLGSW